MTGRRTIVVVALLLAVTGTAARNQPPRTTTTTSASSSADAGRIAYVTPQGSVVVADADGSNPKTVGEGAVSNRAGLAPLAWRQPAQDAVTYVRNDGALVVAPVDGSAPQIMATDATVPPEVDENILSWDISGSFLVYLASVAGRVESHVIDLTTAGPDKPPEVRTIGNPQRRKVLAQQFSPLDPIVYQKTADVDTGRLFTVAIVEPVNGTTFGSTFSFDDVTFSPDGRYIYAVAKGTGDVEQLVRVSLRNPTKTDLVSDHDRICRPAVSPDSRTIVFAAGRRCQEVWTLRSDGTHPKRLARSVGGTATFDEGVFSWSQDDRTITHAACRRTGDSSTCGGGYWDISVDGRKIVPRAVAGSVLRETRPLLRPVKVQIDVDGPIDYTGRMQVGPQSAGDLLAQVPQDVVRVKGVDENDASRSFEIKAVHQPSSIWLAGTLRIVDSGLDETFPFFARVQPYSLGFAKLRGLWTRAEKMPLQSGQVVVTVER